MSARPGSNHQLCAALVLSIVLLAHGACGRQDLGAFSFAAPGRQELPQMFLDELLKGVNDDALYSELKKLHHSQPNYNAKWPGLRDLLLTADYDDEDDNNPTNNNVGSFLDANSRFIQRLRQLAANNADLDEIEREGNELGVAGSVAGAMPTPMPLKKLSPVMMAGAKGAFKEQATKKNVQYMSPCHFKICNMGRKRDARYFTTF